VEAEAVEDEAEVEWVIVEALVDIVEDGAVEVLAEEVGEAAAGEVAVGAAMADAAGVDTAMVAMVATDGDVPTHTITIHIATIPITAIKRLLMEVGGVAEAGGHVVGMAVVSTTDHAATAIGAILVALTMAGTIKYHQCNSHSTFINRQSLLVVTFTFYKLITFLMLLNQDNNLVHNQSLVLNFFTMYCIKCHTI